MLQPYEDTDQRGKENPSGLSLLLARGGGKHALPMFSSDTVGDKGDW